MTAGSHPRTRSARELRADTRRLAARLSRIGLMDPAVPATLREQIDQPVWALQETIRAIAAHLASHHEDQELSGVAAEAVELCEDWDRHLDGARRRARDLVTESLAQLRSCRDDSELAQSICPAAARVFGVQQALVARIETGTWSLWQEYDASEARGKGQHLGRRAPIPLDELPVEAEVARTGRSIRLTTGGLRVKLPSLLRELTESGPLHLAPVQVTDRVVALLYVPEPSAAPAEGLDDLGEHLQTFTAGLGAILERELLYRRFRTQRVRIRTSLNGMERIMTSLDTGVDLVRLVGREHADTVSSVGLPLTGASSTWDMALTPRERDVMALIVLGHDNSDIAHELAITTNTVKSHLRNIMRKVGAVNRTELISLRQGVPDVEHRERGGKKGRQPSPPRGEAPSTGKGAFEDPDAD